MKYDSIILSLQNSYYLEMDPGRKKSARHGKITLKLNKREEEEKMKIQVFLEYE